MTSPAAHSDAIHRLAVPVLAGVGNALMAQPMVRQLSRSFPGAEMVVFARSGAIAAVFERLPEVARVEQFDTRSSEFLRLVRRMRAWAADICVIPYPSNRWQYSVLAATCGARRVLINRYEVGYWRAMHFLPAERVPVTTGRHDLEQALLLLEPLGVEPDLGMAPVFPLSNDELGAPRAALPEGAVAVHAGSGKTVFGEAKRWAPESYSRLIDCLLEESGLPPVLIEGPDEEGVSLEIRPRRDVPIIRLTGNLAQAAATLAACRLYVGNDSGLAHLAAAVGTPPVTLFGPARPDELCPWGYRHLVVQTPAACAPCFRYPTQAVTPHVPCRPPYCINQIELESVLAKVRLALDQSSKMVASSAPSGGMAAAGAARP